MAGIEVHNLRLIGKLSDGDQNADIQGCRPIKWTRQQRTLQGHELSVCCRELCHSDILCQYWQCPTLVCGLSRVHVYWIWKSVEKIPRYGRDGCQIEDPACAAKFGSTIQLLQLNSDRYSTVQYPLTLEGGASTTSDYAKTVVAGEYIQHYCRMDEFRWGRTFDSTRNHKSKSIV